MQSFHSFRLEPLYPGANRSRITLKDIGDLGHRVAFAGQKDHPDALGHSTHFTASQPFQLGPFPLVQWSYMDHGAHSSPLEE
jgi:hypothetical protein